MLEAVKSFDYGNVLMYIGAIGFPLLVLSLFIKGFNATDSGSSVD